MIGTNSRLILDLYCSSQQFIIITICDNVAQGSNSLQMHFVYDSRTKFVFRISRHYWSMNLSRYVEICREYC